MGEHKQDWFKELVVYQIYPRSFQDSDGDGIGDLKGICMRLDYLAELGVNAIWLCPVYASPNVDNGYDVSDYRQIMKEFGNMEDWDVLLKEAHGRNIAVIMDLVLNHTSDQHEWFLQSRQSRDNPYSDYYIWMDPGPDGPPSAWQSSFGGSAWEYVPERGQYYLHSFSKEQPDLNWKNPQVRQEVDQIVQWWVKKGVDGFRIDAISYLDKRLDQMQPADSRLATVACVNSPGTHQFIHEFIESTCAPGHLMTVGEVTCNTKQDYWDYAARERGEFDMVIPFVQPVEELKTWSPMKMKQNITDTYEGLKESGWWARFFSNHDKPRQVSLYGDDGQFWEPSAKMLAALLHTLPGTPFIYQGEEIGMTNMAFKKIEEYQDIDTVHFYEKLLREGMEEKEAIWLTQNTSRDNARSPMQWSAEPYAGFSAAKPWLPVNPNYRSINVEEQRGRADSIFAFYQALIRLRRENPVLVYGDYRPLLEKQEKIISYARKLEQTEWVMVHYFGRISYELDLEEAGIGGTVILTNYGRSGRIEGKIRLEPYETFCICKSE